MLGRTSGRTSLEKKSKMRRLRDCWFNLADSKPCKEDEEIDEEEEEEEIEEEEEEIGNN